LPTKDLNQFSSQHFELLEMSEAKKFFITTSKSNLNFKKILYKKDFKLEDHSEDPDSSISDLNDINSDVEEEVRISLCRTNTMAKLMKVTNRQLQNVAKVDDKKDVSSEDSISNLLQGESDSDSDHPNKGDKKLKISDDKIESDTDQETKE